MAANPAAPALPGLSCPRCPPTIPAALVGCLYGLAFLFAAVLFAAWRCYGPGHDPGVLLRYYHELFNELVTAAVLGPFNPLRHLGQGVEIGFFRHFALGLGLAAGILTAPRLRRPWLVFPVEVLLFWAWMAAGLSQSPMYEAW